MMFLTKAVLKSKWDRISPAVYWCHQNEASYVVGRCATSSDVARKFADHTRTHTHIHTIPRIKAAR